MVLLVRFDNHAAPRCIRLLRALQVVSRVPTLKVSGRPAGFYGRGFVVGAAGLQLTTRLSPGNSLETRRLQLARALRAVHRMLKRKCKRLRRGVMVTFYTPACGCAAAFTLNAFPFSCLYLPQALVTTVIDSIPRLVDVLLPSP